MNNFPYFNSLGRPFVIVFINKEQLTANNINSQLMRGIEALLTSGENIVQQRAVYGWMDV